MSRTCEKKKDYIDNSEGGIEVEVAKSIDQHVSFCEFCLDDMEFHIVKDLKKDIIRGHEIVYLEKKAYCKECNNELFVDDIVDENIHAINAEIRKANDIISIEEIEELLKKYNIGKRPLSKLLKWGEITITRYLDGVVPLEKYSDKLKELNRNIQEMNGLLEQNKENISESAYKKCRAKIDELLQLEKEEKEEIFKIQEVASFIIYENKQTDPLTLQKILYYSQAFFKTFTNHFLFENDCQAWQHGPVYPTIYHKYKNYRYQIIEEKYKDTILTDKEKEIILAIINYFGCYSGRLLEYMTHEEEPWKLARKGLNDEDFSQEIISKDSIVSYFNEIKSKYNLENTEDIKKYSIDLFNKVHSVY